MRSLTLGLDTYIGDGNKNRDWVRARAEGPINFAMFRSNYGACSDTVFPREWERIKDAGMVRGAYLFLLFSSDSGNGLR